MTMNTGLESDMVLLDITWSSWKECVDIVKRERTMSLEQRVVEDDARRASLEAQEPTNAAISPLARGRRRSCCRCFRCCPCCPGSTRRDRRVGGLAALAGDELRRAPAATPAAQPAAARPAAKAAAEPRAAAGSDLEAAAAPAEKPGRSWCGCLRRRRPRGAAAAVAPGPS
ncbi:unnamed protein product [Prorocentrum cordatum]|uniref:Uncharacterized protein n=1 Tax=Prorocentrum cordatum TaxID=2364126 RepID=A0ABN9R9B9_9DINO|nr:unnamed protein product [Polarella glacialis]